MKLCALLLVLLLASCGRAVTLYTDSVFRAAAPEVVSAWAALAPAHPARVVDLPRDAAKALRQNLGKDGTALIGALLTGGERSSLIAEFPGARLVFFGTAGTNHAGIAVDRGQAWAVVAQKAAQARSAATALFPPDVTPDELESFTQTWRTAGGGTLTAVVWPVSELPGTDALFQWAGTAAEGLVRSLRPGRVVHTDPGMDRPPESTGLTWRIRREGLGEILWNTVLNSAQTTVFLPVEAVDNSHP